jgi:hypothetical protein
MFSENFRISRLEIFLCLSLVFSTGSAFAQAQPDVQTGSPHSTGRTVSPQSKGPMQPQGRTGPTCTYTTKGAPAESPQGETPAGMQAAPDGASKTIVEPKQ